MTGACYTPTEMTVAITTDVQCGGFSTAIFKGDQLHIDADPQTVTSDCTPGGVGEDSNIGSIVFLPSGSKDGRAAVKAILTRNGKPPTACTDQSPDDCIVATRAFQFVTHSSLRIPIRLLQDCFGAKCAAGYTCVGLGQCAPIDCPDESCTLKADPDAGFDGGPPTTGLDSGGLLDGAPTLDSGKLPTICRGATTGKPVTLGSSNAPPVLTASTKDLVYWMTNTAALPSTVAVYQVAKAAGGTTATGTNINDAVRSFGLHGDTTLIGHGTPNSYAVRVGMLDVPIGGNDPTHLLGNGDSSAAGKIVVATTSTVFTMAGSPSANSMLTSIGSFNATTSLAFEGSGGAADALIVAASDGVYRISNGAITALMNSVTNAELATNGGGKVLAGGGVAGQGTFAIQLVGNGTVQQLFSPANKIAALAADLTTFFFSQGSDINSRSYVPTVGTNTRVIAESGNITHIMVDADCIYYWVLDGPTETLKVLPKPDLVSLSNPIGEAGL